MQTHQFAVSAKEGADNYLNYLEETGRGHEEIKVDRIEREDTVYLLYLSKNPSIFFPACHSTPTNTQISDVSRPKTCFIIFCLLSSEKHQETEGNGFD